MRLAIFSRPPFPDKSGGQKRAHQLLESISGNCDIIILNPFPKKQHEIQFMFKNSAKNLYIFNHTKLHMFLGLVTSAFLCKWYTPINVRLYFNLKAYFIIRNGNYNDIICNNIRTSPYPTKAKKLYVDFVDCISANYINAALTSRNILTKIMYRIESILTRRYEKFILSKSYKAFSVSNVESKALSFRSYKVNTIPVFVDDIKKSTTEYERDKTKDKINHTSNKLVIGFLGKMDYEPNLKAVIWFIDKVLKKIPEEKLELRIIGGSVPKAIINKTSSNRNIIILGWIEKIQYELKKCDVLIAPMQSGSGLQTKILDYLQTDKIILCNQRSLNGFDCLPRLRNFFILDDPNDYNKTIEKIIQNKRNGVFNNENEILQERREYLFRSFAKEVILKKWKAQLEI